jgi:hypothetical protein
MSSQTSLFADVKLLQNPASGGSTSLALANAQEQIAILKRANRVLKVKLRRLVCVSCGCLVACYQKCL